MYTFDPRPHPQPPAPGFQAEPGPPDDGTRPRARGLAASIKVTRVSQIELSQIDAGDATFNHRLRLCVGNLAEQMAAYGLLEPVILQPIVQGLSYRIVSGFRRVEAARQLGWPRIPAIVRPDLDEQSALIASVAGNENREPYNDLERAHIIETWERSAMEVPVTQVLGIGERQKRNLLHLLHLPRAAREALIDPGHHFSGTHGMHLLRARSSDPTVDIAAWVERIDRERLSVSELARALAAKADGASPVAHRHLFDPTSNLDEGLLVFRRQVIKVDTLSRDDRDRIRDEAERLIALLT